MTDRFFQKPTECTFIILDKATYIQTNNEIGKKTNKTNNQTKKQIKIEKMFNRIHDRGHQSLPGQRKQLPGRGGDHDCREKSPRCGQGHRIDAFDAEIRFEIDRIIESYLWSVIEFVLQVWTS